MDTRAAVADGFHEPNFTDAETRTFTLPSSPDCIGLPATAGAWSLNVQFRPIASASYITLFPTGTTMPTVSTLTASPAAWVQDAAIVPAGTGGAIDVYCQFAGRVVIDINGYYGPQSVVTSLTSGATTLTGDVTLAQGSNVTITPSGTTFTIAATGGPGGVLPAGSANQTLRNDGASWVASSALANDGSNVAITGNLNLPTTTATSGQITVGGSRFLHSYGGSGTVGFNTFVGLQAGNFTMGGVNPWDGSQNTAVGFQSMMSNTTGAWNSAFGVQSLRFNTTGTDNTAIGTFTLQSNSTGYDNTALGDAVLFSNTTGWYNTATGSQSLSQNTVGSANTAIGYGTLTFNSTANRNTAVGSQALGLQSYNNAGTPWDSFNTAIGDSALYNNQPTTTADGVRNTALGASSLQTNTNGTDNAATGYRSLFANTTGSQNVADGSASLSSNTTGNFNTAVGYQSLNFNLTGSYNTAVGNASLESNGDGSNNTAVGYVGLFSNSTGANNTAGGVASLYNNTVGNANSALGYESLFANTTGFNDTAIGALAGNRSDTITGYDNVTPITFVPSSTGSWNTFIGEGTGATAQVDNCTAVGVDAYCTATNQVRLGNRFVNSIGGEVAWSALSDIRAKIDVRDLDLGLDFVLALRPVTYRLRSGNGKTDMGFVAQDIEALLGDGYNVLDVGGDPERTLSLRHTDLIAPLVKAIQEQQATIAEQRTQIAQQNELLAALSSRLAALERKLEGNR